MAETFRYDNLEDTSQFEVVPFTPETIKEYPEDVLRVADAAISTAVSIAWTSKLVPKVLKMQDIHHKFPYRRDGKHRFTDIESGTEYWFAYQKPDDVSMDDKLEHTRAVLRVETYKPRLFRPNYPNITDLETISGSVYAYENFAAALVYHSLSSMSLRLGKGDRKVAAYELQGSDGISFYDNLGFQPTGNRPTEIVGGGEVRYIHLEAPSMLEVISTTTSQYPWLNTKSD